MHTVETIWMGNGRVCANFGGVEHCVMKVSLVCEITTPTTRVTALLTCGTIVCLIVTSSGTQVIVVGVLVAVVLLIFHGLGFLHYIRHRRTGVVRTKEVKYVGSVYRHQDFSICRASLDLTDWVRTENYQRFCILLHPVLVVFEH